LFYATGEAAEQFCLTLSSLWRSETTS